MGLFDELFGKKPTGDSGRIASSGDAINMMVMMADLAMESGDYKQAVGGYKNILKLEPNEIAQYNLGSLYAQGKGVNQDFMEGAYWFRQAEHGGDEQAGKLCMKCTIGFVHQKSRLQLLDFCSGALIFCLVPAV